MTSFRQRRVGDNAAPRFDGIGDADAHASDDSAAIDSESLPRRLHLARHASPSTGRAALIAQAFKTAIVPELAVLHRCTQATPGSAESVPAASEADVARLTTLALANDLHASDAHARSLVKRGLTLSQICLDVLAPAAGQLGQLWSDDRCSFIDVTTGLGVLHAVLQRVGESFGPFVPVRNASRRVLLASLSGEQHSFGLIMLGDLFRQSGWDVATEKAMSPDDLAAASREGWFALAGLSVASDERATLLASAIRAIRAASSNRSIGVMVGGPAVIAHPELAHEVGADISARDAAEAVSRAEGLRLLLGARPPQA